MLLPSSSTTLHLRKPLQRRGKSWSSAAIRNRFLLLLCDEDNCNFFPIFSKRIFLFWDLKNTVKIKKNFHKQGVISILVTKKSTVISDVKFWSWTWIAVAPFTGNFHFGSRYNFIAKFHLARFFQLLVEFLSQLLKWQRKETLNGTKVVSTIS